MRILLLSSELVPERAGGIASYTMAIAPALAARGHEVHVLSCAPEHDRRDDFDKGVWWHRRHLIGGRRTPDLNRYRQSATRMATAITCQKELRRLGVRFDLIESPEWLAESTLVSLTTKTPLVVNLHTPLRLLFSFDVKRFSADLRLADRLERLAVRRADAVTSASRLLAETLSAEGWLRQAARTIRLPVDLEDWSGTLSASSSPRNVLVVGRLEPRKAPEIALEAVERLSSGIDGIQITFVGRSRGYRDGKPYGEWLAARAERLDVSVKFVPQIDHREMPKLYEQARVVAIPSRFESFSVAAVEAMASGRPIVYTSMIGVAEVLRGTEAGTEVGPNDPSAMAAALSPYLADAEHAAAKGAAARSLAKVNFEPAIIAAERERCYEETITIGRKG